MTTLPLYSIVAFLAHTDLSALLSSWWGAYVSSSQAQVKCELIFLPERQNVILKTMEKYATTKGIWRTVLNMVLDFEFHILQVFYKVNLVTKLEVSSAIRKEMRNSTMRRNVIRVCPLWISCQVIYSPASSSSKISCQKSGKTLVTLYCWSQENGLSDNLMQKIKSFATPILQGIRPSNKKLGNGGNLDRSTANLAKLNAP